jgi:hypothetical protein
VTHALIHPVSRVNGMRQPSFAASSWRGLIRRNAAESIYERVPALVRIDGNGGRNPSDIRFVAMFHMANDSGLFRMAEQLAALGLVRQA